MPVLLVDEAKQLIANVEKTKEEKEKRAKTHIIAPPDTRGIRTADSAAVPRVSTISKLAGNAVGT